MSSLQRAVKNVSPKHDNETKISSEDQRKYSPLYDSAR